MDEDAVQILSNVAYRSELIKALMAAGITEEDAKELVRKDLMRYAKHEQETHKILNTLVPVILGGYYRGPK